MKRKAIINENLANLLYRKVHELYLWECFDELYKRIDHENGNILKYTRNCRDDSAILGIGSSRQNRTKVTKGWIEINFEQRDGINEQRDAMMIRKIYRRRYPQYLQTIEVIKKARLVYWKKTGFVS